MTPTPTDTPPDECRARKALADNIANQVFESGTPSNCALSIIVYQEVAAYDEARTSPPAAHEGLREVLEAAYNALSKYAKSSQGGETNAEFFACVKITKAIATLDAMLAGETVMGEPL